VSVWTLEQLKGRPMMRQLVDYRLHVKRCRIRGTVVALAALATSAWGAGPAGAQLPGSGYTFDRQWNCGLFYGNQACWFDGVLGYNSGYSHTIYGHAEA
jgi:hypothetical protein